MSEPITLPDLGPSLDCECRCFLEIASLHGDIAEIGAERRSALAKLAKTRAKLGRSQAKLDRTRSALARTNRILAGARENEFNLGNVVLTLLRENEALRAAAAEPASVRNRLAEAA